MRITSVIGSNCFPWDFYRHCWLKNVPDLKKLCKVVKLLLVLCHGQTTVERGFSSNKEGMVENLAQHSLVA